MNKRTFVFILSLSTLAHASSLPSGVERRIETYENQHGVWMEATSDLEVYSEGNALSNRYLYRTIPLGTKFEVLRRNDNMTLVRLQDGQVAFLRRRFQNKWEKSTPYNAAKETAKSAIVPPIAKELPAKPTTAPAPVIPKIINEGAASREIPTNPKTSAAAPISAEDPKAGFTFNRGNSAFSMDNNISTSDVIANMKKDEPAARPSDSQPAIEPQNPNAPPVSHTSTLGGMVSRAFDRIASTVVGVLPDPAHDKAVAEAKAKANTNTQVADLNISSARVIAADDYPQINQAQNSVAAKEVGVPVTEVKTETSLPSDVVTTSAEMMDKALNGPAKEIAAKEEVQETAKADESKPLVINPSGTATDFLQTLSCDSLDSEKFQCYRKNVLEIESQYVGRTGGYGSRASRGRAKDPMHPTGSCYRFVKQGDRGFGAESCNFLGDYEDTAASNARNVMPRKFGLIDLLQLNSKNKTLSNLLAKEGLPPISADFAKKMAAILKTPSQSVLRPIGGVHVYCGGQWGHIEVKTSQYTYASDFRRPKAGDQWIPGRTLCGLMMRPETFVSTYKKYLQGQIPGERASCQAKLKSNSAFHASFADYLRDWNRAAAVEPNKSIRRGGQS